MSKIRYRRNTSFRRKEPEREPYDLVLIVCEGRKTEPAYLKSLKNELRLSSANIKICGKECGSAPKSVVEYALAEFKKTRAYQRVFCVIDKDCHETYLAALDKIKKTKLPRGSNIDAITSVPCFEFWLLLHFEDTAKPYTRAGSHSPCDMVIKDLKRYLPTYSKGDQDIFHRTFPHIEIAIQRAELLEKRQVEAQTDNPSTKMHQLVTYLRRVKQASAK